MRLNARLDEQAQEQLEYLTAATGQSVSQVVRESVARYCAEVKARRQGPVNFLALVGKGDSGRSEIASNVKREMGELLAAKHGKPPR
jgi:predicted DNA-binding protein